MMELDIQYYLGVKNMILPTTKFDNFEESQKFC